MVYLLNGFAPRLNVCYLEESTIIMICGQSYKCSMFVNYVSRVVLSTNFSQYNSRVVDYDRSKVFIRLATVRVTPPPTPLTDLLSF